MTAMTMQGYAILSEPGSHPVERAELSVDAASIVAAGQLRAAV